VVTLAWAVLWPAVLAGAVAVAVTAAIERWGGVVGGLLGTLPTTIVPASLGILAASDRPEVFAAAMGAVPVGMLANAAFLWTWRVLPPRLPDGPLSVRLAAVLGAALSVWALLAAACVGGLAAARGSGLSPLWLGGIALVVNVGAGVAATRRAVPAPIGRNRISLGTILARAVLAAAAVGGATALAWTGDGLVAGVASVFPAIFVTTMVGLWLSQDAAVPAGAVGPMMLGASSVGAYALLAAALVPAFAPWVGLPAAWIGAAVGVTVPAALWLRSRT
jgi:hypothetical protein